jgi:hypothetical protein
VLGVLEEQQYSRVRMEMRVDRWVSTGWLDHEVTWLYSTRESRVMPKQEE